MWTATTAAGVGITWVGVGDALRGTAWAVPDVAAQVPVLQGRPPSLEPTGTPTHTAEERPATGVAGTSPSPTRPPSTSGTTAPSTGKPAQPKPSPAPSSAPAETGAVRTYVVVSGSVVLSLGKESARLVSATPDNGFEVKVWEQTAWLRVDLTDGVHGSAVFARWNGHPPLVEVYEY